MLSRAMSVRGVGRLGTASVIWAAVGAAIVAMLLPAARANALSTWVGFSDGVSRDLADRGVRSSTLGFIEFGHRAQSPNEAESIAFSHAIKSIHGDLVFHAIEISSRDSHRSRQDWARDDPRHGSWPRGEGFRRLLLALVGGGSHFAEYLENHPGSIFDFDFHAGAWKPGSGTETDGGAAEFVPEPGTALMLGLGMIGLAGFSQRRRRLS